MCIRHRFGLSAVVALALAIGFPTITYANPTVTFKAPSNGQTISGNLYQSSACEVAGSGIKKVVFFLDGTQLNTENYSPWQCNLDTRKFSNGTHMLKAVAYSSSGASSTAQIGVRIQNGTAPTVTFKAPSNGWTISGNLYQSSTCEVAGSGIAKVVFFLDGTQLNTEGSSPWQCNLDTRKFLNGTHTLKAVAYSSSGASSTAQISVNIQNGTTSPTSSPGFFCTFASSPTECGFYEQSKTLARASVVGGGRDGSTAVRLHTEPGDSYVHGSGTWERNDLALSQGATECYEGWEAWWSHSILFPGDFVVPPAGGASVVMNFHDTSNSGKANFSVWVMPNPAGLHLQGYGGASIGSGQYGVTLGPVVKNAWYDFVYQVRWSSGSDGYFNAWVNGTQLLAHRGPTLYQGQGCYLKLANLHSPFGQASSVIHDRIVRGRSREAVWPATPAANPAPAPTAGNPLLGPDGDIALYVDPNSAAKQEAQRLRQSGNFTQAGLIDKIASNPQARWFGSWNWDVRSDVEGYVAAAAAAGAVPVLVAYNIPNRDCGGYSSGGATTPEAYRAWIRSVADGIAGRKAVVVLEPDALALNTCLSEADKAVRNNLLKDAINVLKAKGAIVYLDAGNANWISSAEMTVRLANAGVAQADGFSLNVSNFIATDLTAAYGDRLSSLIGWKHYVIDTSRNGRGANGEWCNPWGRGLGTRPTGLTGNPLVDAYLWVKRPGESDGTCNGGPAAGTWWLDYALDLARNAVF